MLGSPSQEPDDSLEADPVERRMVVLLGLPEEQRAAAVDEACAAEPALAAALRARWKALCELGLAGMPLQRAAAGAPESLGDFDLLEQLGAGGMGVVYRAHQRSLGREVALKLLRPEAIYFERSRERFRREVAAIASLRHPSIVPVFAVGEEQGVPYFAMELIDGATLADLLVRLRGRAPSELAGRDLARALGSAEPSTSQVLFELDWSDACAEIARQVAEALEHAHTRGILHRDVKPSNVALTRDGRAQLFDFGLAVSVGGERLTQTGGQLGTLHYMSPEQVRGEALLDARSDVYSLGVTLYELLALETPFAGVTRTQLESRILAGSVTPLRELNASVARELEVVCAKAMEPDPARRYATARAFADDLVAVLRRRPVSARAPTRAYRARRWVQRNPALASALLAGFGLLGVAPSVLLWRERGHTAELTAALGRESRALRAAEVNERLAREETAKVLRLSDVKVYQDLMAEADGLWPPHPERIAALESWIGRAQALIGNLELHREALSHMRATAVELGDADGSPRTWRFDSTEVQWQHDVLTELIAHLEGLQASHLADAPGSMESSWNMPGRLAFARDLERGFAPAGAYRRAWDEVLPEIAAMYPGLEVQPHVGLLPIGPDPVTGLWEFAHLMTGEPVRRASDGRLLLKEETGVVLVLLPEGTFWMGAQDSDPGGRNFDPQASADEGPVHEVQVSACLLSKYELTQGQWLRLTGRNPSYFQTRPMVKSLLHPVEQISWEDCMLWLPRAGLALPSEGQWEYGARAGTQTAWWTGSERESLRARRAANLADQSAARIGAVWSDIKDWPELDDGHPIHAPVGSYAANDFGLHDVAGNMWELCLDGYDRDFYGRSPARDPVAPWQASERRVYRGGAFGYAAIYARSASRDISVPSYGGRELGVRPARALAP